MKVNLVGKVVRKTMFLMGKRPNGGVVIQSSKWVKDRAKAYEEQTMRNFGKTIITNAKQARTYPNESRAIECVINGLEKEGKHTFQNILILKNPYQYAPLCAMALFKTKKPYKVKVKIWGKTPECDVTYKLSPKQNHRVPIMGLYADYENTVTITLLDHKERCVKEKTFQLKTEPLKGNIATLKVNKEVSEEKFLYGLTLVYGGSYVGNPYAFDRNGDIRYSFALIPKTYGFQPVSDGKFMFLHNKATRLTNTNTASIQLYEVDQMGRFHKLYNLEKGSHHDFVEIENGNLVTLSNCFENGTCEDAIIEIDRKSGKVVNEILLKDYIDEKYVNASDWAHVNSVVYNEKEKTAIVSLRNLHAVWKLNYEKKEIIWILGNPLFWKGSSVEKKVLTPMGNQMEWFFQQHSAYLIENDSENDSDTIRLMLYDNHWDKRTPVSWFDNDKEHSFIKIYSINEKKKTVCLEKSFPCEKSTKRGISFYDKRKQRLIAVNGNLTKRFGGKKSTITEFDFVTGRVLNKFSMEYGCYRAYELKFNADKMSEPMNMNIQYSLGEIYAVKEWEKPDIKEAKMLPEPVLEKQDKTEQERKTRLELICRKDPSYYVDPEQDMARIDMLLKEDFLYITMINHLLEAICFVGEKHTYYRDYTDTVQERPEYFARTGHTDVVRVSDLKDDYYKIYFKHRIGLYQSGFYVKINEQRKVIRVSN